MDIRPILSSLRRHKTASALIALQIALTCAIVCNAVFLISGRIDTLLAPSGVDEAGLVRVQIVGIGREANAMALTREDLAALRAIPGVIAAESANQVPMGFSSWNTSLMLAPDQQEETANAAMYMGGPALFEALGLTLVAGTWPDPDAFREYNEDLGLRGIAAASVVITRDLAELAFPGENAVGRDIYLMDNPIRVVGVAERLARPRQVNGDMGYSMWLPIEVPYTLGGTYLIRTEPGRRQEVLDAAVPALNANSGSRIILNKETFEEIRGKLFAQDRTMVWLLGQVAVLAQGPMPSMFGVPLERGRFWTDAEQRDGIPVAVITTGVEQALFGGEDALDHEVHIGSSLFRIIGISGEWAPQAKFHFLAPGQPAWGGTPDSVFLPLQASLDAGVVPMSTRDCDDNSAGGMGFDTVDLEACRWLALWAELPDQAAVAEYSNALAAYAGARHEAGVFERVPASRLDGVSEWLAANHVVPDSVRLNLWLASGLLALCMVNVAGVLAARFLRRSGELGVRRVLGAPRRWVVMQCLVEAGAIGLLGGLLALPATLFGLWIIRMQDHGYTDLARFEPHLFALLCALSVLTGFLVGLVPAIRAARIEPVLQVKSL